MDAEKKPEQPEEQEAVFTTIVGGRPPGSGTRVGAIPRGVEVLLKKASVDSEFRKLLLEQRAEAARTIDLELTEAEREMLAHIPAEQLDQIISSTKVSPVQRALFMGAVGSLMLLAVVGGMTYLGNAVDAHFSTLGHTVKLVDGSGRPLAPAQDVKDTNDPNAPDPTLPQPEKQGRKAVIVRGIRPDELEFEPEGIDNGL